MEPVVSNIEAVTVYRRGARVVRRVQLDGAGGAVTLAGLPLSLEDGSIRVQVEGSGVRALDATVGVAVAPHDPSLLPPRDEEQREARLNLALLQAEIERLEAAIARLEALDILERPQPRKGQPPAPTPVQPRLALARLSCEEAQRLGDARIARQAELKKAERRLAELDDRARRASSARNAREHELSKTLTVKLDGTAGQGSSLTVEYVVPGACWSPGYTLWLEQGRARLALRALIAQRTGEEWKGVRLALSTAEPDRFVQLPELARLRIGRAQPARSKRGWREPPEGAQALFADYDSAFGAPARAASEPQSPAWDEPSDVGMLIEEALSAVPPPAPPGFGGMVPLPAPMVMPSAGAIPMQVPIPMAAPAPAPMPSAMRASMPARAKEKRRAEAQYDQSADYAAPQKMPAAPPPPALPPPPELDPDRMAYRRLRLLDSGSLGRGELTSIDGAEAYSEVPAISAKVDRAISAARERAKISSSLPSGYQLAAPAGVFDDTYAVSLPADVPSDGKYHSIPISEHEASVKLQFVTVPREASDAFRSLELRNPIESALLPGPVDVYEQRAGGGEASWLLTARMPSTPPKGELRLGLGVEQGIKVARNTTYAEQTTGLLGGGLALVHDVSIELRNGLSSPAEIEVRERVPVKRKDDDEVVIDAGPAEPSWEPWDQEQSLQGGRRWKVTLEAGGSRKVQYRYTVKISGKNQLAGGNRREA